MNIQEYISSGILEAYVLGELSQSEEREVVSNVDQYPEIREELTKIELTLEKVAFTTSVTPPAFLKDQILNNIQDDPKVIPIQRGTKPTGIFAYVTAASVILAIVSSILAYNYYDKWKSTKNDLESLIAQNERVAQDYNTVNQKLQQIESDFDIISSSDYQKITLPATENSPGALAFVYWNQSTEEVYLNIENLKVLSKENQYQLWAIIDGKPVDAGVFDTAIAGNLLKMKNITGAAAFAVTIEPRGGSKNPTMETMQVMGEVDKS